MSKNTEITAEILATLIIVDPTTKEININATGENVVSQYNKILRERAALDGDILTACRQVIAETAATGGVKKPQLVMLAAQKIGGIARMNDLMPKVEDYLSRDAAKGPGKQHFVANKGPGGRMQAL